MCWHGCFLGVLGFGIWGFFGLFLVFCESAFYVFFGVCFLIEVLLGFGFFVNMEVAGHFRTARSGVYMVIGETDSVIRFGFLVEWMDAREGTVRRAGHSSVEQVESRRLETGDAHFRYYSTAPPEHSLSRCSETAGEVWKGLGFGV